MTSRERLLRTLAVKPADRVPVNCYELVGWNCDDAYNREESYSRLLELIREKTDCLYMPPLPTPAIDTTAGAVSATDKQPTNVSIERRRDGESEFTRTTYRTPHGELTRLTRCDDNVFTTWTLEHLLKTIEDIDKYLSIEWKNDTVRLDDFAATQRQLGEHGIMMPSIADPICVAAELYEMGQFLIYAVTETQRIRYLMDAIHEQQMANLRAVLTAGVDAGVNWSEVLFRLCGPEYATSPYLSPEFFSLLVTPYVTEISDVLHQYGARMRFHCHGNIANVLDEIMKTEPDAIDPLEPPPDGDMELGEVKQRIGDRVCLFGNIELRLLEHGSIDEVRQFVIGAIDQAKTGGGYVIMPTAAPINAPLSPKTEENYNVFIETALEYGQY